MSYASKIEELIKERDALRLDSARLAWLVKSGNVFDAFSDMEKDRYDYAMDAAMEAGREEPSDADDVEGFRRLLDAVMAAK